MQGTIWQSLLDYAYISWNVALKESKKATIYDDILAIMNSSIIN